MLSIRGIEPEAASTTSEGGHLIGRLIIHPAKSVCSYSNISQHTCKGVRRQSHFALTLAEYSRTPSGVSAGMMSCSRSGSALPNFGLKSLMPVHILKGCGGTHPGSTPEGCSAQSMPGIALAGCVVQHLSSGARAALSDCVCPADAVIWQWHAITADDLLGSSKVCVHGMCQLLANVSHVAAAAHIFLVQSCSLVQCSQDLCHVRLVLGQRTPLTKCNIALMMQTQVDCKCRHAYTVLSEQVCWPAIRQL